MKIFSTGIALTLLTLPAMAAEIPYYGHPKMPHRMAEQLPCFMHLPESQSRTLSLDLTRLCAAVTTSNTGQWTGSSGTGSSGTGSSGTGPCNNPDDLDSRGRRCGGRASSEKRGGR